MKRLLFFFGIFIFVIFPPLEAQEEEEADWNIDSLFDEPLPPSPEETTAQEAAAENTPGSVLSDLVRQRGFIFDAAFGFYGGAAPGWSEAPWFSGGEFSPAPGAKMKAAFGLDAQISPAFRVKTSASFEIPKLKFNLDEFFFDYSILDVVFFRGGKYDLSWGISPNFSFTNLLARLPPGDTAEFSDGGSYILKAELPIGVGSLQFLGMTRKDLIRGDLPEYGDIGMGGKGNFIFRWADVDFGILYQQTMPLRGFISLKTTIVNTEIYAEALGTELERLDGKIRGAGNIGVVQDFFSGRLTVNGEVFYNGEGETFYYRPGSDFKESGASPFIEGFNGALNLLFRFGGRGNPRLFAQGLYALKGNTAQVVPGFRITPLPYLEIYFAVPMALGGRDGYYYRHNADANGRPFSIVLLVTLKGSLRYERNF